MALLFSTAQRSAEITRAVKAGTLRKLASKIYTDDLRSPPEDILRRHRLEIAAHFYPGAVISHRSALEGNVSPAGKLHLTLPQAVAPVRELPGLELRLWQGPGPQADDIRTPVIDDTHVLYTASQPRAVLENLQIARARGDDEAKTLAPEELEHWLDRHIRIHGLGWLDALRAKASTLSTALGWTREQQQLDALVDAFNGRRSTYRLSTDVARARSTGQPFDPERIRLFTRLHARLAAESFADLPRPPITQFDNRAFWEAYFSNFIEGTKFTVDEARVIVYDQDPSKALEQKRPDDAHDVRETYRLIIDPNISGEVPRDAAHLIELLKRRHARMMASRLKIEPGVFKKTNNEFGARVFVAPELVAATLTRAWPAIRDLPSPTARALYALFVVAEVHPFNDGNGRISRLAMNAELESAGHARLILPTSLRIDYLTVLEALTLRGDPDPYVAFAHKLIDINSRMPFVTFEESHAYFRQTGALDESSSGFGLLSYIKDSTS
jgi:hypothetical protein